MFPASGVRPHVGFACAAVVVALTAGCTSARSGPTEQRDAAGPDAPSPLPARTDSGDRVVVVELFSSEGCSSCPPADRVLADLAASPPAGTLVVALEHHVDYWDDLGWKDPFASASATRRQRAYASMRGTDGVFTPEAVVDGKHSITGSRRSALVQLIEDRSRLAHLPVRVTLDAARTHATVHLDRAPPGSASLFVGVVESGLQTKVLAGENRGETLAHAPVVRELEEIGAARAGSSEVTLDAPVGGTRSVVAFVQAQPLGEIYGAAIAR